MSVVLGPEECTPLMKFRRYCLIADIDNVQCCNNYYKMDTSLIAFQFELFFLPGIEFPQTFEAVFILGRNFTPLKSKTHPSKVVSDLVTVSYTASV